MNTPGQIAKHLREAYIGGNWTGVNLKEKLDGVTWQQATTKLYNLNTIADLVFHVNYYVSAIIKVLEGGPLDAHDKYSYDYKHITSKEEWQELVNKAFAEAEQLAKLVEQLDESKLSEDFSDKKYGSYYRNLHGVIEHTYYHLGQISLIKKMIAQNG